VFGPPISLGVSVAAMVRDRRGTWARAGLAVSSITFALWLISVVCGGFG
jgi:hypothetical protein